MILQACSACARQYDVTHLSPKDRVRCVCDAVMSVSVPSQLTVRARKCSNCGGRVEPGEAACSFCGSELFDIDLASTLCPRCFKRIEDDAKHCRSCGVAIAPQALTALRAGQTCPRCTSPKRRKAGAGTGKLCVRALGHGASVVECASCRGLWVTTEAFAAICAGAQDRPEISLGAPAKPPIAASEPERKVVYIPCLTCGELMLRKNFRYKNASSHVVVDYCRHHGVWLDQDELERIVAFIRARADADVPFDVRESMGEGRRPGGRPPSARRPDWAEALDVQVGGLGGWILAETIGSVFGEVIGELFD